MKRTLTTLSRRWSQLRGSLIKPVLLQMILREPKRFVCMLRNGNPKCKSVELSDQLGVMLIKIKMVAVAGKLDKASTAADDSERAKKVCLYVEKWKYKMKIS